MTETVHDKLNLRVFSYVCVSASSSADVTRGFTLDNIASTAQLPVSKPGCILQGPLSCLELQ